MTSFLKGFNCINPVTTIPKLDHLFKSPSIAKRASFFCWIFFALRLLLFSSLEGDVMSRYLGRVVKLSERRVYFFQELEVSSNSSQLQFLKIQLK
jgi:hypothetical protein